MWRRWRQRAILLVIHDSIRSLYGNSPDFNSDTPLGNIVVVYLSLLLHFSSAALCICHAFVDFPLAYGQYDVGADRKIAYCTRRGELLLSRSYRRNASTAPVRISSNAQFGQMSKVDGADPDLNV